MSEQERRPARLLGRNDVPLDPLVDLSYLDDEDGDKQDDDSLESILQKDESSSNESETDDEDSDSPSPIENAVN